MRYCKKHFRAGQATEDNVIRRICIACWIHKATNTHSQFVMFTAFQPQQWLQILEVTLYVHCVLNVNCLEKVLECLAS